MKNVSVKTIAAVSIVACMAGPAFAENCESAGAREFVTARPLIERLDFRAQAKLTPALRPSQRQTIVLPAELPKFKPVSIYLTMGTGF